MNFPIKSPDVANGSIAVLFTATRQAFNIPALDVATYQWPSCN